MILTILLIASILLMFVTIVTYYHINKTIVIELLRYVFVFTTVALTILSMALITVGYQPVEDSKSLNEERDLIMYNIKYEKEYNFETVLLIQQYNKDVNKYNNYWCRFYIEDRSYYLIDVNDYLIKFKK